MAYGEQYRKRSDFSQLVSCKKNKKNLATISKRDLTKAKKKKLSWRCGRVNVSFSRVFHALMFFL
jgi:hypothetical protein